MRKTAILMLLPIVALLFGSCSNQDTTQTTAPETQGSESALGKAAIPPGSTVDSATLRVYVTGASGNEVLVHWGYDPWGEMTVTWDQYSENVVPDTLDVFQSDGVGWRTADVTSIVQDWVDGYYPNHGFALKACFCEWPMSSFETREGDVARAAELEVCYRDEFDMASCTTLHAARDTYIWAAWPDSNYGGREEMLIGAIDSCAPEAISLVWFPIEPPPPEPASIGDWVWNDADSNGIQNEPVENGVADVVVRLYDCDSVLQGTDTTDADGFYLFDDLEPNQEYYLRFALPVGYTFSPKEAGGAAEDSDVDSEGFTECTLLEDGEDDMTWDCGIYEPQVLLASIGDRVWFDADTNGVQGEGEPGVQGIKVRLFSCADVLLDSTTTDEDGLYRFDSLSAGQYYLEFDPPSNFAISPQNQGGNDLTDSDADRLTGLTACTTLEPDEDDMSWDCGLFHPPQEASIGNWVWYDGDLNGIQNEGEYGVAGVEVNLYTCTGDPVASTTTDADGYYLFAVDTGSYYVEFVLPSGWSFTPPGATMNDARDSDASPNTGRTTCTQLVADESDMTWDAGIYEGPCPPSGLLGDRVWYDADRDGIQDDGEPGIGGVQVQLLNCDGVPITGAFTDGNGYYYFNELPPGGYTVQFVLPYGYEFSPYQAGGDVTIDSDADPATGLSHCVTLEAEEMDSTIDAGMYLPEVETAGIGDRVWFDVDVDGRQDAGEPGVADIEVILHQCGVGQMGSILTDASGYYSFTDLAPGNYRVEFVLPEGYAFTARDQGFDDTRDSDPDTLTGLTVCTNLQPGEYDDRWDAGIHPDTCPPPIEVGDLVWNDLDQDGIQDAGEPGLAGVTVTLYDCIGSPLETTVTDGSGHYYFVGFGHGNHEIGVEPPAGYVFSPQNQGADEAADSDFDPANGLTDCIYFNSGETDFGLDAGLYMPGGDDVTIGDRIWYDVNRDGIQNVGEPGMPMIQVTLYECDGYPVASTWSDNSGFYLFDDVPQGEYYIGVDCPHGFAISPRGAGSDAAKDSDVDPDTGEGDCTWFTPGTSDRGWDAGIFDTFEYPHHE